MDKQTATTIAKRIVISVPLFFALSLLASCGGGSGGGYASDQDDKRPPVAVASVLTLEDTSTSTTKRYQARANSQVVLTGKDSFSDYAPILTYQWTQLSGPDVTLIERTSNAVAFDIPAMDSATELQFQLTITDANGKTDSDAVSIDALPINDSNRFLSHPNTPRNTLTLLAALSDGENTGSSEQEFSLQVTTRAHWLNRAEVMDSLVVHSQDITSQFPKNFSPSANYDVISEVKNPRLEADLILLNIDDINKNFETEQRDRRLDIHQIGTAYLTLEISVQGTPAVNFELFALNANSEIIDTATIQSTMLTPSNMTAITSLGASVSKSLRRSQSAVLQTAQGLFSTTIHMDSLLAKLGLENAISANNYYALLDPSGQFSSFAEWSKHAGFSDADGKAISDPSISHALYLNNYDLGFGRDMWLRKDEMGNVYSYVTNYPTVEAGLDGRQDFAIVAMEYSDNPDTNGANAKIVKFYAFVPDERTGDYIRSTSMNFDGRGEKFLPGVCTACHQSYQEGSQFTDVADADLDATFMPWDLDSFLFAAAENPALVESSLDASRFTEEVLQKYSRESQQDALRNLNLGALATYKDNPVRHAAAIQLIHGWYGDEAQELAVDQLPENNFNGDYIQPGWETEPDLYHKSFARNCRICHAQINDDDTNFDNYVEFIENENLIPYVFARGQMPMARLTMDRFWLGQSNGADVLRAHLEGLGETPPAQPGEPTASFTISNPNPEVGDTVLLSAPATHFKQSYNWALTNPQGSIAELTATTGSKTSFVADVPNADFALTLTATNSFGAQTSSTQTLTSFDRIPIAPCLIADVSSLSEAGALLAIPVISRLSDDQIGDGPVTIANTINGNLGTVSIDNSAQTLSYQLNNPLIRGVDRVSFQLSDVNDSLSISDIACATSPEAGFGHLTIDTTNAGTLTPTDLVAAPDTNNSTFEIDLAWVAPTDITPTGYRIYRGNTLLTELLALSYTDGPLPHGSNFDYTVTTVFNGFESNPSNTANTSTLSLTPSNLVGDNSVFGQISLNWDAPAGINNPITYTLYRTDNGITTTLASSLNNTGPFVDNTVEAGKSYDYTVTATDASPQESDASNTISNTAKPSHPNNPTATAVNATQINLSWDAVTNADVYKVYRKLSSQGVGSYSLIASPSTNSYSVTSGLSAGNSYDFRIGATVNDEDSITYAAVSATTHPNAPTNLTVAANTAGVRTTEIRLQWTAPSGDNISGYNIYRTGTGLVVANTAGTSYVESGLASGTLYSYTIEAVAGGQASAPTSASSGATYPTVPTSVVGSANSTTQITVSWNANGNGTNVRYTVVPTPGTSVGNIAGVSRAMTGLTSHTNYNFRVRASANGLDSNLSSASSTVRTLTSYALVQAQVVDSVCSACHTDATAKARIQLNPSSCLTDLDVTPMGTYDISDCDAGMAGITISASQRQLIQDWLTDGELD